MAMMAGLMAGLAGQSRGQHDAYVDALATSEEQKRLLEQQRQFDAQMAERTSQDAEARREYDANHTLATDANAREQWTFDQEKNAWRPPSKTDKYGGYKYQTAAMQPRLLAQQARAGELGIQGQALSNESASLANAGKSFANKMAPLLTQLDIQARSVDINNAQQNDPRLVQQRSMQRDAYLNSLNQQTYAWQRSYDMSLTQRFGAADPTKVIKDYEAALKGVDAGQKTLNATTKDGSGKLVPVVDPQTKAAIEAAEQSIVSAQDPMGRASQILATDGAAGQLVRRSGFSGHVYQVALAEYLRRKMPGQQGAPQQPPTTTPAGLELNVPGMNGPRTPFSHYGSGGSTAPPPFPGN